MKAHLGCGSGTPRLEGDGIKPYRTEIDRIHRGKRTLLWVMLAPSDHRVVTSEIERLIVGPYRITVRSGPGPRSRIVSRVEVP